MDNWLQNVKQIKEYLYIDENDLLRDKCRDDAYLENLIQQGEKILSEYNEADQIKIFGSLGHLYRIKGDTETALPYLERYKDYAIKYEDDETATLALLRYAEGLKYAREYNEALAIFEEVLERCQLLDIEKYENIGWQQLGKCYLEMGDLKQAENCFLKALILRRKINDPKLLEASESVLNFMMKIKK